MSELASSLGPIRGYMDSYEEVKATKTVLGYWNIRGIAQPIRYLLVYPDVDFHDFVYELGGPPDYSTSEWENAKHTLGLDQPKLPYYIDEDVRITETLAIMKHISAKYQPSKMLGKTQADQV